MNAQLAYLDAEVMTASPPKLRLLLIEAALRLSRQCLQSWEPPLHEDSAGRVNCLRKILRQLLTSVEDDGSDLARNLQSVYMCLFGSVTEAQLSGAGDKLVEVVKVLEVERETWQILSQRYVAEDAARRLTGTEPGHGSSTSSIPREALAATGLWTDLTA